jgi:hypothetical protein
MAKKGKDQGIEKRVQVSYSAADKVLGLLFLETTINSQMDGEVPHFKKVAEITNIPRTTLNDWWKKKETILKLAGSAADNMPMIAVQAMSCEIPRIIAAIARKDYNKMSTRDLTSLLTQYIRNTRLLSGQSTGNNAHVHYISPVVKK